jgi:hypothetical protein
MLGTYFVGVEGRNDTFIEDFVLSISAFDSRMGSSFSYDMPVLDRFLIGVKSGAITIFEIDVLKREVALCVEIEI